MKPSLITQSPDFSIRNGIRKRLSLAMISLVLFVCVLLALFQITSQRSVLQSELSKRVLLTQETVQRRAVSFVQQVKRRTEDEIASYNFHYLSSELNQLVRSHPELDLVVLINNENTVMVHTTDRSLQQNDYKPIESDFHQVVELDEQDFAASTDPRFGVTELTKNTHWLDYNIPINVGATQWGTMILSFSLQSLNNEIERSELEIEDSLRLVTYKTLAIMLLILLVTYLVIAQISQRLSAPLMQLTQYAKQISEGDFSIESKLPTKRDDEVGVLSDSFIEMAAKLKSSYEALEDSNQTLEKRVKDRTQELADSQQQLVHSEKMAALGLLIASIAHEINTPLGAIQASAENAEKDYGHFLRDLAQLVDNPSADDKAFFTMLLKRSVVNQGLSTREERKIRRHIETELEMANVQWAEEIALLLAEMGLQDALDELLPYMSEHDTLDLVRSAHQLFSIHASLSTINSATARASKVVFALKSFSHKESSGEKVRTDINQGLDTVLELYRGLFKQGCEVVRDFGVIPELMCYSDELNQVWTNLIHNALQAMDNKGVLKLTTYVEQEGTNPSVIVTVADSGPGIPEHLTHRVWESFFTTKSAGEGSGLGLGICKRIVEKHQGELTFVSEPGNTVFKVRLPLA